MTTLEPPRVAIPNATIFDGALLGGQPSHGDFAKLKEAGYRTVVNLRTESEPGQEGQSEVLAALGLTHLRLPIPGPAGLTRSNVEKFARLLEDAEQPVIVHCASGNRIGALFALRASWLRGASPQEALATGKSAGLTKLEPVVRELLDGLH